MKGHLFYENTFIERKSKSVSAIIRQLQGHPDFQDNVLKLWKLFTPLQNSSISYSEFESYYVLILHLLFPIYPRDELAARAKNDLLRLTECPNSDINFYQFCEFFAKLAVLWLEDVSSERAILFINFLYSRTTRKKITRHGKKEELQGFIFVTFLLPNFLQDTLSLQRKRKLDHNNIFFDETWIEDSATLNKYQADPETLIETEIIPYEEVIPIGFAAENILTSIVNSHQVKDSFPPFEIADMSLPYKIKPCKACPFPMCTTIWTGGKTNLISEKVETSATKTFGLLPIIFSPKQSHFVIRMNPALERLTAYERLQDKQGGVEYFNIHSSFYRYEEYKIDLVRRINLQNEFAQQHGRYFDDSNTNPNKNEKHILPLADVFLKAYQTKLEFADLNKEFESTKASSSITQLSLYKDKDLFSQFQSHFSKALPQDPNDSFEEDLLDYANEQPLYILVIGKPKSGVSTFSKLLAQKLGVQLISIESFIDALLAKIKDKEENPDPEDVDEEGNQKEFLTPTERAIMTSLSEGQAVSQEAIIELMNLKLASEFTISRGFILDLPVYENQEKTLNWAQKLVQKEIKLPNESTFSHVIYLDSQTTETRFIAAKIMEAPDDQKLTSLYDREILKKPKPKRYDEDGEEIEEEVDEDAPPIPDEKNLVYRPNESEEVLQEAFGNFQQTYEYIQDNIIRFLAPSRFIKIEVSGLNADEVLESCLGRMRDVVDPLRPVAIKLEPVDDSNLKDLMTQTTEETEVTGLPRRQWSAYRNIDPVALEAGKLVVGKGEFPCAYGGRVFVFETEENQNKFFDNPKKFVNKRPEMPKGYNLAILGPRKSGKDYVAEFLSERYGWKVVNVEEIIARKLLEMRTWEAHFASNPKTGSIHPSEDEYKEFKKGGAITAASILPIVLWELGFPLYKKPPPPKTEEELEAEAIALAEEQERLKLEEEKAAKSKKKESKREREERERLEREKAEEEKRLQEEKEAKIAAGEWEEERPPSPPPEDYKLKELGVQPDEEGVVPPVKGYIFVGYPQTEEQVNALKEHGIVLDKILYLVDNSEEPGAALQNKGDYKNEFSLENELEKSEKTLQIVKEGFGEEIVKEIPITFGTEEFKKQVLWAVDPFYINVDQDGEVVAPGDVGEDDEPVKWGDCGSFCPVALADEAWLLPGKEEFECQVRGKRYRFFSEESMNKFKLSVEDYLNKINRRNVKTPGPKILFMGIKGSGVHTQMGLLQKQYRISRVELAADLLRVLNEEKLKRKKQRELMRGFKPKEFDDEGVEIEDPETAEDPSDFDLKAHEIDTLKRILAGRDEMIINANMFDVEEGKVSTALNELMSDGSRLPEACVFMRCTEENMVKRIFKEQEIVDKYNNIMAERKEKFETEKAKRIDELLMQKQEEAAAEAAERAAQAKDEDEEEEGEQEEVEPVAVTEEEIAAIEAELDDGEAPVLEEMIANAKSEFITRRDTEMGKLDEYIESFRSANLPVIEIDSDKTIPTVYEELKFKLRDFLDKRENSFEKFHVRAISDEVLPFYEKSYTYRKSKFETGDPKQPWKLPQNKQFPLVYRSRIFFFKSDEERKNAMEIIANLARNQAKPKDVNTNISVFIIGKKKTGKSTLAKMLAEKLGLIRIKIKHLLNRVIEYPYWANDLEIEQVLREGRVPEDEQIIDLLAKRLQMRDCVDKGYILDGYPQNREQAQLLTEKGIIPDAVFGMEFRRKDVLDRCKKNYKLKDKFGYDNRILHERLDENDAELAYAEAYYISNFNNFSVLDPKISKWGVYDQARNIIHEVLEQKYNLAIGLITGEPKKIGRINLTQSDILANIGEFMNYSPVSLKSKKLFHNLSIFSPNLYLYNKNLYFLGDQKEGEDFAKNPDQLIQSTLITELKNAPRRLDLNEVVDAYFHKKAELKGNCPVTLGGNGKVVKGEPDITLQYNNQIWYFRGEEELLEFKLNPLKYYKTQLPDKLPINEIQVQNQNDIIKKKAQTGEATAYLEHHLGNITMKAMAQLGNKRLKYPTISYQETALKFMAIALKASNPNKSEEYKKKYAVKLKEFLKHCSYSEEILGEAELRDKKQSENAWNEWDEEAFLKRMEEFHDFMKELKGEDKIEYFKWFIR